MENFHITQKHTFVQAVHKLIAKFVQALHKFSTAGIYLSSYSSIA